MGPPVSLRRQVPAVGFDGLFMHDPAANLRGHRMSRFALAPPGAKPLDLFGQVGGVGSGGLRRPEACVNAKCRSDLLKRV